MAPALLLLALCLAATVVAGPLGFGSLVWRLSPIGLNQQYGADAVSLFVVAPLAAVTAWLWSRRSPLAAPLAFGVGLVTLYYAVAAVMGADYLRYAGNNERFFPLLLVMIVLSWTTAARAWSSMVPPPPPAPWLARPLGTLLVLGGSVIGLAWLRQLFEISLAGTLSAPADLAAYSDAPSAFWIVRIVDLGFIVPLSIATGVGLWHGTSAAIKAAYGVCTFLVLQAISVLAMGTIMLLREDPSATPGLVLALTPISVGLLILTGLLFASARRVFSPR